MRCDYGGDSYPATSAVSGTGESNPNSLANFFVAIADSDANSFTQSKPIANADTNPYTYADTNTNA